jgi:hypothetical protein
MINIKVASARPIFNNDPPEMDNLGAVGVSLCILETLVEQPRECVVNRDAANGEK